MHRFIEPKRSLPVNFTRELRVYFQSVYKDVKEGDFDAELGELDKLRQECSIITAVTQASINNVLLRYYVQLLDLESRVDLESANIKVPFVWYNCSAGDDKKIIVSAANIRFEEACILFNVAVFYIQLAGMESKSTSEGLKKACNYYMMAAGVFQYICDNLTSHFDVPTPADVSPTSLNFLLKWSLASAQECFVLKGIIEKSIKDGMLAKLSLATGQMYEVAKEMGEELGIGSIFGKVLSAYLVGRSTYYKALAQVKKSAEALSSHHYGEEIARLNESTNLLNRCKDFKKLMDSETISLLDSLAVQIVKNLERAIKDNSIIYHETIPNFISLPDVGQAIVARATAMPDWTKDPNVQSRPILTRLVPQIIRIRSAEYYDRRNTLVESIYSRLTGLLQAEQNILSECNLSGTLDSSQNNLGLPQSIIEKSQKVRSEGGAESLFSSLTTVETLRNDAKQLIRQVEDLLSEESAQDMQARIEFGDKWNRPESETLTKKLHQALDSYRNSMKAALESDTKVQRDFDEAIVGITSLDSSQSELEESIPACTGHNSHRGNQGLSSKLREKLAIVSEFESRRTILIEQISKYCAADNVEEAFTAFGEEVLRDDVKAESIIYERLNNPKMTSFLNQVDCMECEQQVELCEIKSMASSFSSPMTSNSLMEERQNALKTLESAYVSFTNLSAHLQEALNFYSGLLDLLQKLRENTRDYTVSRGIELEELKTTLGRNAVASAMSGSMNSGYNQPQFQQPQQQPQQQQWQPQQAQYQAPPQQSQYFQPQFQGYQQPSPVPQQSYAPSNMPVPVFHPQQTPHYMQNQ